METSELVDSLWPRIEPDIRRLAPQMTQVDLLRTRAMVKRMLVTTLKRHDPSTLDYASKYVRAAETDERAARLLLQSEESALSVYHLQQSAEKAMKGFCLSIGDVTIEQLRTTHRTPEPLLAIIEQRPGGEMASILSTMGNRNYKQCIKRVKKLVNSDQAGQQKLRELPMISDRCEFSIEVLLQVSDQLMALNPLLEQKEAEVKRVLAKRLPEYRDLIVPYSLMRFGQAAGQCYILGSLTFAHESCTRYPGGFLEPQDYTQELGIVQAIPAIIERTPRMLDLVRDVISVARTQMSEAKENRPI